MVKKAKNTGANKHRPAERKEGTYPQTYLRKCLTFAEAVKAYGGGKAGVDKSLIGSQQSLSGSALSVMLASAKCFGIIDGTGGTYRLTEDGNRYFFPTSDGERRQAELAFLATPPAYKFIIGRFDGDRLPTVEILANLLTREGLAPPSWSARAASFFAHSASELGVVDGSGFLRYRAAVHTVARVEQDVDKVEQDVDKKESSDEARRGFNQEVGTNESTERTHENKKMAGATATNSNVWVYSEAGATVRLETPNDLPKALWERLKRYVEMLGPARPGKGKGK
jgi:hypothetical protein